MGVNGTTENQHKNPWAQLKIVDPFYSKVRKYVYSCLTNQPTPLARFPNLAILLSVNLIVGFTIKGII